MHALSTAAEIGPIGNSCAPNVHYLAVEIALVGLDQVRFVSSFSADALHSCRMGYPKQHQIAHRCSRRLM
jgi:hypothetical protein